MHVRVAGEDAHGGHVGLSAREFFGRDVDRVEVVAVGVVPGVLRDSTGVEGEEVGDRFRIDLHAHGVDQDETGDDSPGVAQGHLGGCPAPEGRADDQDVAQSAFPQGVQVGEGEVVDAGEPHPSRPASAPHRATGHPLTAAWRAGEHRHLPKLSIVDRFPSQLDGG
jgi:hypothetical protein